MTDLSNYIVAIFRCDFIKIFLAPALNFIYLCNCCVVHNSIKPAEKNEEECLTELTKTNKPKEERKSKSLNYTPPIFDENNKQIPSKSESKVGRNDPCPCGSGKKYKKCCG